MDGNDEGHLMESDTGPQRMVRTVVNFTLSIPPLPNAGGNTVRELGAVPGIRPGYTGVRYTFITKPMSENFPNVLKCNCCHDTHWFGKTYQAV